VRRMVRTVGRQTKREVMRLAVVPASRVVRGRIIETARLELK